MQGTVLRKKLVTKLAVVLYTIPVNNNKNFQLLLRPRFCGLFYYGIGILDQWHACSKWQAAFTAVLILSYFFWPTSASILWLICIHMSDCAEIIYELPLLPNNTASKTFLHTSGAVRSVDWSSAWRWLGENVVLDRTFYNIPFKQDVAAAPVTSKFSSFSNSSRKNLIKIY
jgi:hypothetical protein